MSVRTSTWRENLASLELQVSNFHHQFENPNLDPSEIDKIHTIVKAAIKNLDDLINKSKARYNELSKKRCCCSNKIKCILWALNGVSKICEIAGAAMAAASESQEVKWWGVGILSIGAFFDLSGTVYGTTVFIDSDTMEDFADVNKQGVENAKAFDRFLDRLKEVQALITQQLTVSHAVDPRPISDRSIRSLNQNPIVACLQEYNELPADYQRDSTYGNLVSRLIQRLPPTDDLNRGLREFEMATTPTGVGSLAANSPLPVRYLSSPTESTIDEEIKGSDERQSQPEELALERGRSEESTTDHARRWACYKDQLETRFGLRQRIPFLVTPSGCHVDRKGIQRTVSTKDLTRLPEVSESIVPTRPTETIIPIASTLPSPV